MLFLSAGHSNSDSGAVANGYSEAALMTEFRNLVIFYVSNAQVPFISDGKKSDNLPLKHAMSMARQATIAVEFHLNSGPAGAGGVETLSAPKDFQLGAKLCYAVSRVLGIQNRGPKPEDAGHHSRLGFVQAGGLILELFFITNKEELQKYLDKKWLVAKAVAELLIQEMKHEA